MRTLGIASAAVAGALLAAAPTATQAAPSPSPCRTAGLVVWISSSQGAAGSTFYTLDFTNQSGARCTLTGYPGASARSLSGRQLGSAATHDTSRKVRKVTLANGATASTTLRIVDALIFPTSACSPADAAGVRVYPPNQTRSKLVPLPFKACTKSLGFMMVQPVRHS